MPIRLEHISKTFRQQKVLCDISLSVQDGEVVGLLGPNGAGKSTLMKIILGIWQPDAHPNIVRQVSLNVGYLPEQNPLYMEMYVREYLEFFARINHCQQVDELIERVGLLPEANKRIGQLSKGFRQRVGLARAIMGQPKLLILDEPTTGFDPNQLTEIRPLIRQLGQDRTVILSTHILQEVKEMCDRVIILDNGVIKGDKRMNEINNLEQWFSEATGR